MYFVQKIFLIEFKMEGRQAGDGILGYTWKVLLWSEIVWYIKVIFLEQHRILDVSWRVGQGLLVEIRSSV